VVDVEPDICAASSSSLNETALPTPALALLKS